MANLLLKLIIPLEKNDRDEFRLPHGPLFQRWLPNGEDDAILIKTNSKDIKITIWFERCGFVLDGWIRFDYKRREVDPEIVKRQAKLDAGPLRVKIEIKAIKKDELNALIANKNGDKNYIKVGKKITKILNENIIPFIKILRFYYGQHWLRELDRWNSKEESLGCYFRHLKTTYSVDGGKNWYDFIPDEIEVRKAFTLFVQSDFSSYLSQNDWSSLNKISLEDFKYTLSAELLLNSHKFRDQGDYKQAFIDASTALEVAIRDFFNERISLPNQLKREMESFWQLPIRAQVTVISALIEGVSHEDITNAINAIEMRNSIVHEGWSPKADVETKKKLDSLIRVIAKLISNKPMKFPSCSGANRLFPLDHDENQ